MADTIKRETYHHGGLREALINAADNIIRERGIEGFSLREATRRAGVSPGAPKHHFGSVAGLLTEVVVRAFGQQAGYLEATPLTGETDGDLRALVMAYIRFAIIHPGHYRLMFRASLLDETASLQAARMQSLEQLARMMAAYDRVDAVDSHTNGAAPSVIASLATAHGLCHMVLDDTRLSKNALTPDSIEHAYLSAIVEARWPDRLTAKVRVPDGGAAEG